MFDKEKYGKTLTPLVTLFKEGDQSVDYVVAEVRKMMKKFQLV